MKKEDKYEKKIKKTKVNYIYEEEFKTNKMDLTMNDLKEIFNRKYYNYIKRKENCFLK